MRYATAFAPGANQIRLRKDELAVAGIKQMFVDCTDDNEKYEILAKLYTMMTIGSSIIFVKVSTLVLIDI